MTNDVDYSVVIPLFNERENVKALYGEISAVMAHLAREYEILFVDDGSTDGTTQAAREICRSDRRVRLIRHPHNHGQSAALSSGFRRARGRIVISIDGDLQNDPKDIPILLEKMKEGYDVVCGWRRARHDPLLSKKIPSKFANLVSKRITRISIHDQGCTLRAYRSDALKDLELYGELHRYIPSLLRWRGQSIGEVEVHHRPRVRGKTKYSIWRLPKGFLDLVTVAFFHRFLTRPLHFFGGLSLALVIPSTVGLLYLAMQRLFFGVSIQGRPLLLYCILLFVSGVQLATVGLLGEMISRAIYLQTGGEPFQVIEEEAD